MYGGGLGLALALNKYNLTALYNTKQRSAAVGKPMWTLIKYQSIRRIYSPCQVAIKTLKIGRRSMKHMITLVV